MCIRGRNYDDLMNKIQNNLSTFSKGQRLIAKYIIEHYDKAAFLTASKLGSTVGVSESTVVRFATELGYAGYPQLQKALQEMIRNKLTAVQRMEVTSDRMGDQDILRSVLSSDIDKIRRRWMKFDLQFLPERRRSNFARQEYLYPRCSFLGVPVGIYRLLFQSDVRQRQADSHEQREPKSLSRFCASVRAMWCLASASRAIPSARSRRWSIRKSLARRSSR